MGAVQFFQKSLVSLGCKILIELLPYMGNHSGMFFSNGEVTAVSCCSQMESSLPCISQRVLQEDFFLTV
jgi:hypothetical protein